MIGSLAVGGAVGSGLVGWASSGLAGSAQVLGGLVNGAVTGAAVGGALGALVGLKLSAREPDGRGTIGMTLVGGAVGLVAGSLVGAVGGAFLGEAAGTALGFASGAVLGGATGYLLARRSLEKVE